MRKDDDVLRRTLDFKVVGGRGRGPPKMKWRREVEEHIEQIELTKEDATDRTKW